MNFIVNVTAPVTSRISSDNLRGEPRWERNVLAALLQSGANVHTTKPIWNSSEPIPHNLYDGVNAKWLPDSTLITHGIMRNPHISVEARNFIVQYHEVPDECHKHLFLDYDKRQQGCIVATSSNHHSYALLQRVVGSDKSYFLQGPNVPSVLPEAANYEKPYYTWLYRNFLLMAQDRYDDVCAILDRIRYYMQANQDKRLAIIIGIWDTGGPLGKQPTSQTAKEFVFSLPVASHIASVIDRTDVLIDLHQYDVLSLLAQTHLVISPAEPFGLPPFEAAMYGIPTILSKEHNPFQDINKNPMFPELLVCDDRRATQQYLGYLDRLNADTNYYSRIAHGYREYVRQNATYTAFAQAIMSIVRQRGWSS